MPVGLESATMSGFAWIVVLLGLSASPWSSWVRASVVSPQLQAERTLAGASPEVLQRRGR